MSLVEFVRVLATDAHAGNIRPRVDKLALSASTPRSY